MKDDKLKTHRDAEIIGKESKERFYNWLNSNCRKAVSHEEARKITSNIKKPIKDIIKE